MVRPPQPDRVDLDEPSEQEEESGRPDHQAERPRRLARPRGHADDGPLGLRLAAPELRVVTHRHEQEVRPEQQPDQDGEDQDVGDVHPRPERRTARIHPVEQPVHEALTDERQRQTD